MKNEILDAIRRHRFIFFAFANLFCLIVIVWPSFRLRLALERRPRFRSSSLTMLSMHPFHPLVACLLHSRGEFPHWPCLTEWPVSVENQLVKVLVSRWDFAALLSALISVDSYEYCETILSSTDYVLYDWSSDSIPSARCQPRWHYTCCDRWSTRAGHWDWHLPHSHSNSAFEVGPAMFSCILRWIFSDELTWSWFWWVLLCNPRLYGTISKICMWVRCIHFSWSSQCAFTRVGTRQAVSNKKYTPGRLAPRSPIAAHWWSEWVPLRCISHVPDLFLASCLSCWAIIVRTAKHHCYTGAHRYSLGLTLLSLNNEKVTFVAARIDFGLLDWLGWYQHHANVLAVCWRITINHSSAIEGSITSFAMRASRFTLFTRRSLCPSRNKPSSYIRLRTPRLSWYSRSLSSICLFLF
jgi:hypothetical protein